MIRFTIDEHDIQRAEARMWPREGESHTENLIGALGEYAVYDWINQWSPCYFSDQGCSYDLLLGDARTLEVKTQKIAVPPMEHYRVNLSMDCWENKLGVDVWIFVMVHEALKHGWIVASCLPNKRDRFTSHFTGDSMINGHKYRQDTMDCPISELDDPMRLVVNA